MSADILNTLESNETALSSNSFIVSAASFNKGYCIEIRSASIRFKMLIGFRRRKLKKNLEL